jgi:orotate phosphoribosyltransferase
MASSSIIVNASVNDPEMLRQRLISMLRKLSFERRQVTLASGRQSDFFLDCKQVSLTSEGHLLLGTIMLDIIHKYFATAEAVAGVELGGCPLASAVSLTSFFRGKPLPALYIRKATKDHGTKKMIEGDKSIYSGMPVVLLEDVVTTGGSTIKAAKILSDAGLNPLGVVVIVDRLEGAKESLDQANLPYIAISTRKDFME